MSARASFRGGSSAEVFGTLGMVDVTDYGATGNGVTDDTAAIQAAIDAVGAAYGGTVYFPEGIYIVNGALQDTGRSNAQLLLPRVTTASSTEPMSIRLLGPVRAVGQPSVIGPTGLPMHGAIIKGTLNTGAGSLMGAWGPAGSFSDFTYIRVDIQDLTFRMPANPTKSCLDLSHVEACNFDGVAIDAGNYDIASIAAQTTTTSYGLRLPANNNNASVDIGRVDVVGFYNGVEFGEHATANHIAIWGCTFASIFPAVFHATMIDRLMICHCKRGMHFTAADHTIRVNQLNIEHASSGTWTPTFDVSDPSSLGRGSLMWHVVLANSGIDSTLLVDGALNIKRTHLFHDGLTLALTDAATVTIDCSVAESFRWTLAGNRTFANPTKPYDGQVINVRIIQDATGNRTWTLGNKFKFAGGAPLLSTAGNAVDFLSCQYDATQDTWNCAISKAMA